MNIYVGNLNYDVTDTMLKETFSNFGEVSEASVISDRVTGRSKGFGFVEMPTDSEAEEAIRQLDNAELDGRNIKVNQARPRSESPRPRF